MMVRAVDCKNKFESILRQYLSRDEHFRTIITPIGCKRILGFKVNVYSGRSTSVVSLEAITEGCNVTLERTYPMTPLNAYRLVVSL